MLVQISPINSETISILITTTTLVSTAQGILKRHFHILYFQGIVKSINRTNACSVGTSDQDIYNRSEYQVQILQFPSKDKTTNRSKDSSSSQSFRWDKHIFWEIWKH